MRLLLWSATNTFPLASTVTPIGALNCAAAPVSSTQPASPLPASVVTTPADVTFRMRLLLWSATKIFPLASTVTPVGALNCAAAPVPSANPAVPLPASVVTTPPGVIFLMRLLISSATKTFPLASTVTPYGVLNSALAPVPSVLPGGALPASVVTIYVATLVVTDGVLAANPYIEAKTEPVPPVHAYPSGLVKLGISAPAFEPRPRAT